MPLTEKGEKILSNMKERYGEKEGTSVFYASKNKGTISGVDEAVPGLSQNGGPPAELSSDPPMAKIHSSYETGTAQTPEEQSHVPVGQTPAEMQAANVKYWGPNTSGVEPK